MISLVYLEYNDNSDLDWLITKYVNKNIEEMIHCALDYITDSEDVESFSPPRLYAHAPNECLLNIKELWRFSQDQVLRTNLSPVYQFHLYMIIEWYIDIFSDIEDEHVAVDGSIIIYEMDSELKEKVAAQYGSDAVSRFSDVKSYLQELFYDWDFESDFLAEAVQLYMDNSALFSCLTSIEELGKYVELMDGDTYRKYQAICVQEKTNEERLKNILLAFNTDLKKALLSIQKNPQYWNLDENSLNDKLRDMLSMKYMVIDQTRQGVSLSHENVGEIDFLVMDKQNPVAIMEALKLNSVDKRYISDHLTKLLVNYDPQGYPCACLIMYVTSKNFGSFWSKFSEYILEYDFPYPTEREFVEVDTGYSESRYSIMLLRRSDRLMLLSIYAIHLQEKETQ